MKKSVIFLILLVICMPISFANSEKIYVYGGNELVASKEGDDITYYNQDFLGSNKIVSDEDGDIISKNVQYPFGEDYSEKGSKEGLSNNYKFTGQEQDEDLYYYGARYYDPLTSRFISVDPVFDSSISPYAYVGNNPLKYVDPSGNDKEKVYQYLFKFYDEVRSIPIYYKNAKEANMVMDISQYLDFMLDVDYTAKYTFNCIKGIKINNENSFMQLSTNLMYLSDSKSIFHEVDHFYNDKLASNIRTISDAECKACKYSAAIKNKLGISLSYDERAALRGGAIWKFAYAFGWGGSYGSSYVRYWLGSAREFIGGGLRQIGKPTKMSIIGAVFSTAFFVNDVAHGEEPRFAAYKNYLDVGADVLGDQSFQGGFFGGTNMHISPGVVDSPTGPVYEFPTIDVIANRP